MRVTVAGLVTPHVLRVVELANQAEKGMNVDWHVRGAVSQTMDELRDQYNAATLVAAYVEGLETAASQAAGNRVAYLRVLRAAIASARSLGRV
ncbi:MAG TPA: hypothetical protein VEY50_10305 [Lysobacter sp.]|nr:hypothetical protein [Lysobacter sp.]